MEKGKSERASLKEEFEALSLDDKATFLVQAVFSTAATALTEIGERIDGLIKAITPEEEPPSENGTDEEKANSA